MSDLIENHPSLTNCFPPFDPVDTYLTSKVLTSKGSLVFIISNERSCSFGSLILDKLFIILVISVKEHFTEKLHIL